MGELGRRSCGWGWGSRHGRRRRSDSGSGSRGGLVGGSGGRLGRLSLSLGDLLYWRFLDNGRNRSSLFRHIWGEVESAREGKGGRAKPRDQGQLDLAAFDPKSVSFFHLIPKNGGARL